MHQPGASGGVDGGRNVHRDPAGVLDRQLAVAIEPFPKGFARDAVHDVVKDFVRFAGGVHGDDVRVPDARDHPRLGEESLGYRGVDGEFGMDRLDRDIACEGDIASQEDDAHATASQFGSQFVLRSEGGLQARG